MPWGTFFSKNDAPPVPDGHRMRVEGAGVRDLAGGDAVHDVGPSGERRELHAAGDRLPEDGEVSDRLMAAFDALNAAIREEPPLSWYPGEEAVILPPDFLGPSK